ncbi:low specificity L-threonine aldolase [Desulfovibrio mangrovi]|uniref:threonine aldolase family protein n=1 Tax=Desulfovibrio mangrovi TaxID=2976983 RepID=UPI002245ADA0|nr:low specificity L-threonine aldolase [Desulfovibrio mangrovi]UZP68077.1 low specificity L-threonine aldolase [Desulfovibrio mangrovi]
MINFASDNASGVHPRVLAALGRANEGFARAYGDDRHTAEADAVFKTLFGDDIAVFYAINGTGANVLGLKSLVRSYHAVICSQMAHINVDETGAPEASIGCKLLTLPSPNGKITPEQVKPLLAAQGVVHHSQPKAISITQATEFGEVYTPDEVRALADLAHAHGMFLHMDGARIANAAAFLGVDVNAFTRDAGVDVLSFGGTKNGMMFGEAVVFFNVSANPVPSSDFPYLRKQNLQLLSKMRYVSCQFAEMLRDGLWLESARHANAMAQRLARGLEAVSGMTVVNRVEANEVFVAMSPERIDVLQEQFYFYVWDASLHQARLVCSFNTTEAEVDAFIAAAATA